MVVKSKSKTKDRDAYFDRQWAEAEAKRKKRDEARRRGWLAWQKEQEGRAPYSAWLVIPCNLSDFGLRPLAAGTPYWASPFVSVNSPDPSGMPLAGAPNFMVAKIFNLGAATAAPTIVDFYWADPSIGLGAADAQHIGTESVEVQPSIPAGPTPVLCTKPWIPAFVNGGHECAFVICNNHTLDPYPGPGPIPFQPWAERRVGQSNLSVLPAVEQKFPLWAPMSSADASAEIRVLTLRGVAPNGFKRQETAYRTLTHAAHEMLHGLRRDPAGMGGKTAAVKRPAVFAERVDTERVLSGVRLLDEKRPLREVQAAVAGPATIDGANFGEVALRLPEGPGAAVRLALDLGRVDLSMNEVVALNIVRLVAGVVTGGFTVVLANPDWFVASPTAWRKAGIVEKGGIMQQETKNDLETLVIENNAQARITFQVVRQLARHLPIKSIDSLKSVGELVIDDQRLPMNRFLPYLTPDLFPINDLEGLVVRVSAATRMTFAMAAQPAAGVPISPTLRALISARARGAPGGRPPIPSGHFVGPSLFGSSASVK